MPLFVRFPGKIVMIFSLSLLLSLPYIAQPQVRVTRLTGQENLSMKKGIVYSLPRTVLQVTLDVTRTDRIRGPYADFAGELLGLEQVISSSVTSYSLDGASLTSYPEPDPGQVFMVELDEKASEEVLLSLTGNGLLMGSTALSEDEAGDVHAIDKFSPPEVDEKAVFPRYQAASMKEVVDTIIRVVTFDTLTYQEKILKRMMVKQSEKEKAVEAVSLINSIGQDQYSLLVGYQETPYSYEAIKYMNDKLEEQRQDYLKLFTGVTRTVHYQVSYTVVPDAEMLGKESTLTGFSAAQGIVDKEVSSRVLISISPAGNTAMLGADAVASTTASGYYYRIPDLCKITISFEGNVVGEKDMMINQAGVVRNLSSSVTRVDFNPVTGSIRQAILK